MSENALLPTILRYKTTWKTWRTGTQKSDSGCLVVETNFNNEKHDERKLYAILIEFISFFDEKMKTIDYKPSREVS